MDDFIGLWQYNVYNIQKSQTIINLSNSSVADRLSNS